MRSSTAIVNGIISSLLLLLLAACGSSSNDPIIITPTTPSSTYLVEYVPGTDPAMEGKTVFQLKIKKRIDGSPATGLSVSLVPTMHMTSMSHGTPVDVVAENPPASGTYDCTVYYSMGDHMGATLKGFWDLQVKIGSETAVFYPSVGSQMMGADTWKAKMLSTSDAAMGISYYLYSDGIVTAATPTFQLYLTKYMSMMYSPVSTVSSPTGTVGSVDIVVSTDSTFSSGTVTATDNGNGHFSMPGPAATPGFDLSSAVTRTVYVKFSVNGGMKTTDGLASNPAGTNTYSAFKVTSH